MNHLQRILSLVTYLLDERRPVSFADIREAFPGEYGGKDEAAERKFERDKADLHELGVPLRFVTTEDGETGYELDRSAYYLPDVGLTPEETAVLYAAGAEALRSGAFPFAVDLQHALRKVGYPGTGTGTGPGAAGVRVHADAGAAGGGAAGEAVRALGAALAARKTVTFEYRSPHRPVVETRKVDPWGLAMRRGAWTLVGFCHLRKALRSFQVGRMRAVQVNAQRPRTPDYDIPADFRVDDHVAHHPWGHRFHEAVEVTVGLRGPLASLWGRTLPGGRRLSDGADGGTRVALGVTYLDGLCRHLLSLAPNARVEAPAEAAARYRELALGAAGRHGGVAP